MKKNFVIILVGLAAITVFIDPRTAAQSPPGLSSTVWHSQDIGKPGMTGRFVQNGDLLEVYGSGADIWGAADACHFVNVPWQDDVEIVAKVLGVEGTDPWAKAGLMLRDSLEDTSPQVMLAMTPEKGVTLIRRNQTGNRSEDDAHQAMRLVSVPGKRTFQQRGSAGVDTAKDAITTVGFPRWLKLIKRGDVIAAYDSKDAQEWLWLGTIRQSFGQKFYLGFAVASHDNTKICRASFSDIQIAPVAAKAGVPVPIGKGDGLQGSYFSRMDQSGPVVQRIDPMVNFDWGRGTPIEGIGADRFSVRWDGELEAQYTEPYALHIISDDRARVWFNGELIIDEWYEHAEATSSAVVNLEAGKRYALRVDFYENRGRAMVKLLWSSPSTPRQVIPQSQLYSRIQVMMPYALERMYQAELTPDLRSAKTDGYPPGWSSMDVGRIGVEGKAEQSNGQWTVSGAGADIWANGDGFHFVFQKWKGDGEFTVRLINQQNTDPWAKAGLAIREDLRADARHVTLAMTAEHGLNYLHRSDFTGETLVDEGGIASSPVWLRLVRQGSHISAFRSNDGANWEWVGTEALELPNDVLVGMAVNSHDNSALGKAVFDQVSLGQIKNLQVARSSIGTGSGLMATYFDGNTGNVVKRLDPEVNFDWDIGSPVEGIAPYNFSTRWEGWLEAQYDEVYALHVISDDGARLWLDDQLLIDAWSDRSALQTSANVVLKAGEKRALRLEHYQRTGEAVAKLLWSSPSTAKQPIPRTQLYPVLEQSNSSLATTEVAIDSAQVQGTTSAKVSNVLHGSAISATTNNTGLMGGITSVVNAVEIRGAEAVATLGRWEKEGSSLYAVDRRGYVEYDLIVPSADVYQVEIEGASHNPYDADPGFYLTVSLDGENLERLLLDVVPGQTGKVRTFTPYLKPGMHRIRVFWDNARKERSLKLLAVRLQTLQGADTDQNGVKDWVESRLKATCGIDALNGSGSIRSATSPMCVEGRGRYLSLTTIQANQGFLVPHHGVGDRWYAEVPLVAEKITSLAVSYQNDGVQEKCEVEWQPTDVLTTQDLTLRQGDSLLLTFGTNHKSGQLRIQGFTNYPVATGQMVAHRFEQAGVVTVMAVCDDSQVIQPRAFNVNVVKASLGEPIAAWVGKSRFWECTNLPPSAVLDSDSRLVRLTLLKQGQYSLTMDSVEESYIIARLGNSGPVLAQNRVDGFRVYSAGETDLEVLKTYEDGTDLIEMGLVVSPIRPQIRVEISLVVGGVVFEDGTVVKILQSKDLNALGESAVRFLRAADAITSTCHKTKAYQAEVFLGLH